MAGGTRLLHQKCLRLEMRTTTLVSAGEGTSIGALDSTASRLSTYANTSASHRRHHHFVIIILIILGVTMAIVNMLYLESLSTCKGWCSFIMNPEHSHCFCHRYHHIPSPSSRQPLSLHSSSPLWLFLIFLLASWIHLPHHPLTDVYPSQLGTVLTVGKDMWHTAFIRIPCGSQVLALIWYRCWSVTIGIRDFGSDRFELAVIRALFHCVLMCFWVTGLVSHVCL